MEADATTDTMPASQRTSFDVKDIYKHWTNQYDNLDKKKQNAYWFLKLTVASMSDWGGSRIFEGGQSALEAITVALKNLRETDEKTRFVFNTSMYYPRPALEIEVNKSLEKEGKVAHMWERTSEGWKQKGDIDNRIEEINRRGREKFEKLLNGSKIIT